MIEILLAMVQAIMNPAEDGGVGDDAEGETRPGILKIVLEGALTGKVRKASMPKRQRVGVDLA